MPAAFPHRRAAALAYVRAQTGGLLTAWVGLMAMEWGKPHAVGNAFSPRWVLLGLIISATLTAFLAVSDDPPAPVRYRHWLAIGCGIVAVVAVGAAVSSPVGWLVAVVAWGSVLAALGEQQHD